MLYIITLRIDRGPRGVAQHSVTLLSNYGGYSGIYIIHIMK